MLKIKLKNILAAALGIIFFAAVFSQTASAQNYYFETQFKFDTTGITAITEPPRITTNPQIDFPEEARKNGVEGKIKASLTLAEDGTIKNITIIEGLPFGASEAVTKGLQQIRFQPATDNGKPVAVKMFFDYVITASYGEFDTNINKPKILEKPAAVYPESQRPEKRKGKVTVVVAFYADGTKEILNAQSSMPKEFDRAAKEAAERIKFAPATHKKSKKPVSQAVQVEYDFKP